MFSLVKLENKDDYLIIAVKRLKKLENWSSKYLYESMLDFKSTVQLINSSDNKSQVETTKDKILTQGVLSNEPPDNSTDSSYTKLQYQASKHVGSSNQSVSHVNLTDTCKSTDSTSNLKSESSAAPSIPSGLWEM
ncbi:hypothetical protein KQX54_011857 [Cotesia glomerata]|uniref:Uncharacterized protein n=1 Tax=Cotesia glomerata TaxID=32391 RepID=A0AAV7I5G2_COTGL|nr:hypothetical protein KQX54_011857 [Cotesia glomerata]